MLGCYLLFFMLMGFAHAIFPGFDMDRYQQDGINQMLEKNPVQFIILAVIIAPIIEEGMFRSIIKPSSNELLFFICSWLYVIALFFIPADVSWLIKSSFLLLFFILFFIFLKELIPERFQHKICKVLGKYYRAIWVLTAISFGLIHIFNYVDSFEINLLLFLLVVPRIIAGVFFGKIKIENKGLIWPITMHAMNNGAVILLLLFRPM